MTESGPTAAGTRLPDLLLALAASVLGLGIAWLDARPGNDATGLTVVLLFSSAAIVALVGGRRPWLWAILVGVWTPLFELGGSSGWAALAALVVAAAGASLGYLGARLVR